MNYIVLSQFIGVSVVMGLAPLPPATLPSATTSHVQMASFHEVPQNKFCSCPCVCDDPMSKLQCMKPCECTETNAFFPTSMTPYIEQLLLPSYPLPVTSLPVTTVLPPPPVTTVSVIKGKFRHPIRTRFPIRKNNFNLGALLLALGSGSRGKDTPSGKGPYEVGR